MSTHSSGVILSSPTFSATSTMSTSSYDLGSEPLSRSSTVSTQTFSLVDDDSADEIVFDISPGSDFSADISPESSLDSDEEDFVLLRRPLSPPSRSPTPSPPQLTVTSPSSDSGLASRLDNLSLRNTQKTAAAAPFVDDNSPPSTPVGATPRGLKRHGVKDESQVIGLGFRPIVDDISESNFSTDQEPEDVDTFGYERAVNYVTSFLQNPSAYYESSSRLTLLQSLIIELGLSSSSLPMSLKSAQAVLKSQAFLNIREYLAVRDKGPDAVKQVMYPSRSALIKSIRKQPRSRASLDWVKERGLQVLLVTAYHN
ncbi:hypothetical protein F5878DRAFT_720650 [Lentinula raphanica]|uniref:Uncharacterized protein n=1 Tax=Lentinula raphanica TaxID=153919 RepID=A0AA38PK89_9AGAR|nr:hypothetical protein F5878DRAFT_720650 [Lentinula raphanica]